MTGDWITSLAAALLSAVALHAIACRLSLRVDRVMRFLAIGSLVGLCLILVISRRHGFWSVETMAAALTYGFLCELYLFLFTMTISSISSNIVVRLLQSDLAISEIDAVYSTGAMIHARLDRLVATGFVRPCGSALVLTDKGRRSVQIFESLRRFFRMD